MSNKQKYSYPIGFSKTIGSAIAFNGGLAGKLIDLCDSTIGEWLEDGDHWKSTSGERYSRSDMEAFWRVIEGQKARVAAFYRATRDGIPFEQAVKDLERQASGKPLEQKTEPIKEQESNQSGDEQKTDSEGGSQYCPNSNKPLAEGEHGTAHGKFKCPCCGHYVRANFGERINKWKYRLHIGKPKSNATNESTKQEPAPKQSEKPTKQSKSSVWKLKAKAGAKAGRGNRGK